MIGSFSGLKRRRRAFFAIALIVAFAVVVDLYAVGKGISYREIIVGLGALVAGIIVFGGERGIRFGFVLWVLTLALGYRSLYYTKDLPIHPAELVLWLLFLCILTQRELVRMTRLTFPLWIWLLVPFCVLAWWPLIAGD